MRGGARRVSSRIPPRISMRPPSEPDHRLGHVAVFAPARRRPVDQACSGAVECEARQWDGERPRARLKARLNASWSHTRLVERSSRRRCRSWRGSRRRRACATRRGIESVNDRDGCEIDRRATNVRRPLGRRARQRSTDAPAIRATATAPARGWDRAARRANPGRLPAPLRGVHGALR